MITQSAYYSSKRTVEYFSKSASFPICLHILHYSLCTFFRKRLWRARSRWATLQLAHRSIPNTQSSRFSRIDPQIGPCRTCELVRETLAVVHLLALRSNRVGDHMPGGVWAAQQSSATRDCSAGPTAELAVAAAL